MYLSGVALNLASKLLGILCRVEMSVLGDIENIKLKAQPKIDRCRANLPSWIENGRNDQATVRKPFNDIPFIQNSALSRQ